MYRKLKKSIFGIFFMSMMLFLIACEEQDMNIEEPLSYQLIFDTDGGSHVASVTYEVGSSIELPDVIPDKLGYTFIGWEPAIPTVMPNHDLNFKALWTPNDYTIVFDTDGGLLLDSVTLPYLSEIGEIDTPTKVGYTFNGWNQAVPEFMPFGGLTLIAQWMPNNYTITFNSEGGTPVDAIMAPFGSIIMVPNEPTLIGHTFEGWDTDLPETMPIGGLELTALWTVNMYTIEFNTLGGSFVESIELPYNEVIVLPPNPTKLGYIFKGWSDVIPETMPLNGLSVTAIWEKIVVEQDEVYTENFEALQGVKDGGGNFSSYEDFYFIGQSYVEWEMINARIDLGMKKGGNAITIGGYGNEYTDTGMGRIYAEEIFDGIQSLEFEARLPFSPKSTYPQVNGKDKAQNVLIKVFINEQHVHTFKFVDDNQANKGTTFKIENLNIVGTYSLSIEVSSGHRLTVDNIKWLTNKNGTVEAEPILVDFEQNKFDFDYSEMVRTISGVNYMFKEVHTLVMHPDKELDYMDYHTHGNVVARFRPDSTNVLSTPGAYMYNIDLFDYVSTISFDTRLFGSDVYFTHESVINIYYKNEGTTDFVLLHTLDDLPTTFTNYQLSINQSNVQIKIEVLHGKVNIDNIIYTS